MSKENVRRAGQTVLIVFALMLCVSVPNVQAEQTIVSSTTAMGIDIAAATDSQILKSHQWKDYETVMILATLNGAKKLAASTGKTMTAADYVALANKTQNWLDQRAPQSQTLANKSQADIMRLGFDTLFSIPEQVPFLGPPVAKYFGGLEKLKIDSLETTLDPKRQAAAYKDLQVREIQAKQFGGFRAEETFELGQGDPEFRAATDHYLHDLTGLDSTSSPRDAEILFPDVVQHLTENRDGSFSFDPANLVSKSESITANVRAGTDADISDLRSLSLYQLLNFFPADPTTNPPPVPPSNTDNPDQRQAQRQLVLDAAQSSISGISKLIALSDPLKAQQIATMGGATVQIGEAVSKYLNTVEKATTGVAKGLAAAALTGSVVGAAVDIFSLFASDGLSGDQGMMQQIHALSQQIDQLHKDMDERFDRVDTSLNTIFLTLNQNFAQISYDSGVLNGDVHAIQAGLLDVQAKLDRIEQYSLAWISALSKQQLIQDMNGCLGYRERTGTDIGFTQYAVCENIFYTWAHDTAINELWAGIAQPSYSNDNISPTLSNFPLSVDINYLAQFPSQNLGLPALSNGRLANRNEWALGARAYLQLADEWPKFAAQVNSSRIDNIIQIGTALSQAMQNISTINISGTITANQPLSKALVDQYKAAAASLQTAIQNFATTFSSNPSLFGVNLWGGPIQTISYSPSATKIAAWCDGTSFGFGKAMPDGNLLVDKYISAQDRAPFVVAERLGLGTISYCLDAWFENGSNKRGGSGIAHAGIFAKFNGNTFAEWDKRLEVASPSSSWPAGQFGPGRDLYLYIPSNWDSCDFTEICIISTCAFRRQFEGNSPGFCGGIRIPVVPTYPSDVIATQKTQVNDKLREFQRTLYGQISIAFSGTTPIQTAAQRLTGQELLLQAYVSLGLPIPLEANDYLRSLLFGDQRILDGSKVQSDFADASTGSISDTTINAMTTESSLINARANALSTALTSTLDQNLQNSGTPSDIDLIVMDLQAFKNMKNTGALAFCSFQLSSNNANIIGSGGITDTTASSESGCGITPYSDNSWLHSVAVRKSSILTQVSITADPNTIGTPRSGTVILGDQVYRVFQTEGTPIAAIPSKPKSDFGGDGKTDILWRDTSGNVSMWLMNGYTATNSFIANILPGLAIVSTGDFDGDGKSDILWRDATGAMSVWLMDGTTTKSSSSIGTMPTSSVIAGVADFNGDGKSDILWRDNTGNVSMWMMNGYTPTSSFIANIWIGWTIVGMGDFNGDGKSDILWRDGAGNMAVWMMNGSNVSSWGGIGSVPTSSVIAGVADFNGDGRSDILWRDNSGNVSVWLMNGYSETNSLVANIWLGWTIVGTGDFNGDGRSDILWRDGAGNMAVWMMNGTGVSSWGSMGNVGDRMPQ